MEYNDTALDDFLDRFGDKDSNKKKDFNFNSNANYPGVGFSATTPRPLVSNIATSLEPMKAMESKIDMGTDPLSDVPVGAEVAGGEGLLAKAGGVSGVMSMASGGMELFNMAKGGGYDTSAEGGGIMSATSAISSGAMKGAQAGANLGPWGAAGGAIVGGLIGGLSRGAASREYGKNLVTANLKENAVEKAENADTFAMEQGQESLGLLKGLRQKQLGIQNT